ncbi:MAG: carboxypeptidase-like regulatory domain-containing protein, partial [Flavobacteriaceae bacterium]
MKKNLAKRLFGFVLLLVAPLSFAQSTITGTITDAETNDPIPGANVIVVGTNDGITTDFDGNFTLTTNASSPIQIEVSVIGFESQKLMANNSDNLNIVLKPSISQLDEVVIAASRTPERIAESPVSIERLNLQEIKNNTSSDFYTSL